jgi:hypothetical protein
VDLLRRFSPGTYAAALDAWQWRDLSDLTPMFTGPFGDVFLEGRGGVWFLDLLEGTLTREWDGVDALHAALDTPAGSDRFLLAGLAHAAHEAGHRPGPTELLTFSVPPLLGAPVSVDNVTVMDAMVYVNLQGQLHRQVADLPPGTDVSGFTIAGEEPPPPPRAKRGLFGRRGRS